MAWPVRVLYPYWLTNNQRCQLFFPAHKKARPLDTTGLFACTQGYLCAVNTWPFIPEVPFNIFITMLQLTAYAGAAAW
jgi:hypothetical protein